MGRESELRRNRDADQAGILGMGRGAAGWRISVDGLHDARRRGEVGLAQLQTHHALGAMEGAARSTVAPLGMRPTVGWLTALRAASAAGRKSARHHGTLRHGVDLAVGAAQRGKHQDAASAGWRHRPMAATVASMCKPGWAKAGSVAVTITAAVFLT